MVGRFRAVLGKKFNEGARQLWLRVARGDWTVATIAEAAQTTTSVIYRYMYGDRQPDRKVAARIAKAIGIDADLWDAEVAEPFEPPTEALAMSAAKAEAPASSPALPSDTTDDAPDAA